MEPKLELNSAPKLAMASLKSLNDGCTTTAVVLSVADRGRLYGFALRPAVARAVLLRGTVSLSSTDSAVEVAVDRPECLDLFLTLVRCFRRDFTRTDSAVLSLSESTDKHLRTCAPLVSSYFVGTSCANRSSGNTVVLLSGVTPVARFGIWDSSSSESEFFCKSGQLYFSAGLLVDHHDHRLCRCSVWRSPAGSQRG